MQVEIKLFVQQVRDGTHYKGHIEIGGAILSFEQKFTIPVSELKQSQLGLTNIEEVRQVYPLTMRNHLAPINLDSNEYIIFLPIFIRLIGKFYDDPKVRRSNRGIEGIIRKSQWLSAVAMHFGIISPLYMSRREIYDLKPRIRAMLIDRRFGIIRFGCNFDKH